jgi:hypothetical protein
MVDRQAQRLRVPATVRITWVLKQFRCSVPGLPPVPSGEAETAASLAATLTPGDLETPEDVQMGAGQVLALMGPPATGAPRVGACSRNLQTTTSCAAAIIESPPAAPVLALATSGESTELDEDCPSQPGAKVDPNPNALTLEDVNGTATFVAAGDVQIAPIDLAELAGRATPAGSCQSIADAYHALIAAPQPCSSDIDCDGFFGLSIPDDPAMCGIALTVPAAAEYADLLSRWGSGCRGASGAQCPAWQSAVCRDGACALGCRNVALPACPPPCPDDVVPGAACGSLNGATQCRRAEVWCSCMDDVVGCEVATPAVANCPYSCADAPGAPPPDGGI